MNMHIHRHHYRVSLFTGMVAIVVLLSGCVHRTDFENKGHGNAANDKTTLSRVSPPVCSSGEPMVQTTLYFGLNRPHGPVITSVEWQSFVDNDVTSRFKEGLTVIDAKGQWLGNDGRVAKENSKALVLIHKNDRSADIDTVRSRYKQQFEQESVMRVDNSVCVDF
ncbi:DUF3574 domain-containing protein [Yersinia frederiksenii]|uniref:DUF3574 domain-containing protein n=1 Tax=Yersinia frederiksenii TaxID=29484 RepID=UPI0005E7D3F6|nr:DUF3574 domain-containing protein [Yersinia frederiksenii]CFR29441.1 30S ribosomal protein S3 [Yersinia frederiksenii]